MSLFSFVVHANETVRDVDVKNLTDIQVRAEISALLRFSKYQEVIDFCEEVLMHKPHNPEVHFGKGKALSGLEKWQEAIDSYDLAIKYKRQPVGEVYYYKGMDFELQGYAVDSPNSVHRPYSL
jgi:tetratricopeptide (TPR) repeat protein